MNGFLIGRFQPFHFGHLEAVNFALSNVDQLYIGIGSSNKSYQPRNPFTAKERNKMIIDKTPTEGAIRISETIDEHLVTRVYYFMSQQEAVEAFQEEFYVS